MYFRPWQCSMKTRCKWKLKTTILNVLFSQLNFHHKQRLFIEKYFIEVWRQSLSFSYIFHQLQTRVHLRVLINCIVCFLILFFILFTCYCHMLRHSTPRIRLLFEVDWLFSSLITIYEALPMVELIAPSGTVVCWLRLSFCWIVLRLFCIVDGILKKVCSSRDILFKITMWKNLFYATLWRREDILGPFFLLWCDGTGIVVIKMQDN